MVYLAAIELLGKVFVQYLVASMWLWVTLDFENVSVVF